MMMGYKIDHIVPIKVGSGVQEGFANAVYHSIKSIILFPIRAGASRPFIVLAFRLLASSPYCGVTK